jgi:hypothetical protein
MKPFPTLLLLLIPFLSYEQSSSQSPNYVITFQTPNYVATPVAGSGLSSYSGTDAYTVIQNAITALTPSGGGLGSAGGWIHIAISGNVNLTNELTIIGWEGSTTPYSRLKITGEGTSTHIVQNTAGKNAIVIRNNASVYLADFLVSIGSSALSGILGDDNGSQDSTSISRSILDNIIISSNSSGSPALWLKNFISLTSTGLIVLNNNYTAAIFDNTSSAVSYGNSVFNLLTTSTSRLSAPNAGLIIRSSNAKSRMDHIVFNNFYCFGGFYGLVLGDCSNLTFNHFDIESPVIKPIIIGVPTAQNGLYNWSKGNTFTGGDLVNGPGNVILTLGSKSYGNKFINTFLLPGDGGTPLIVDSSTTNMPNSFDVNIEYPGNPNPYFARPTLTSFSWRSYLGTTNWLQQSSGTFTPTLTNTANITSSSLSKATYLQMGNVVHVMVSGTLIPTTAGTSTTLTLSLPVVTTNASQSYIGQITFANSGGPTTVGGIGTISATSGIAFQFQPTTNVSGNFNISFDYTTN